MLMLLFVLAWLIVLPVILVVVFAVRVVMALIRGLFDGWGL